MIHYQLQCGDGHNFDGWFKDSASYEQQAQRGLLECPVCGGAKVDRALMTPAVGRKANVAVEAAPAPPSTAAQSVPARLAANSGPMAAQTPSGLASPMAATGQVPAHIRAMLQRLRAEVEKNCDYVGPGFADEARRIHRGESDRRGIYGEASPEDAADLADEGIEIARVPWVPPADG